MNKKDELSLADLYLSFRKFGKYTLRKWWLILLMVGVGLGGALAWRSAQPSTYSAKLTYIVEGSTGGGSGVLAQLGLGGSGEGPNIKRIEEIGKSDLVGIAILGDTITIAGKSDLLGNHLVTHSGLREMWLENGMPEKNMVYRSGTDSSLTREELKLRKRLLGQLYREVELGPLVTIETDALTLLATVTTTSLNEEFTIALANLQFDQLQRFYFEKTQARQLSNITVTESLADSLLQRIQTLQSSVSRLDDQGRNIILKRNRLGQLNLQQEEKRTQTAYVETFKNLQIAKFTLRTNQPNIEVIDRPFSPLFAYEYPLTNLIMISGVLSGVLSLAVTFILFLRHNIIKQLIEENRISE